jgi:hypothetical protein
LKVDRVEVVDPTAFVEVVDPTAFTVENVPPLGAAVLIALNAEKPTGERFNKGERAVICEHLLLADGRVSVGGRTADGRVLRSTVADAFEGS